MHGYSQSRCSAYIHVMKTDVKKLPKTPKLGVPELCTYLEILKISPSQKVDLDPPLGHRVTSAHPSILHVTQNR